MGARDAIEKAERLERLLRRAFASDERSVDEGSGGLGQDPFHELSSAIHACDRDRDLLEVLEHMATSPLMALLVQCTQQAPAAVSDLAAARTRPFPASTAIFAVNALGAVLGLAGTTQRRDLWVKMLDQVMCFAAALSIACSWLLHAQTILVPWRHSSGYQSGGTGNLIDDEMRVLNIICGTGA